MIEARIHLPTPPGPARQEFLEMLAEVLVRSNHDWATREVEDGREPHCCIACVRPRIRYTPPPGAAAGQRCQNFWPAPAVIQRGQATCLDAAAYDAGMARWEGKDAYVAFEDINGRDFHAVAVIDGKRVDSAQKLIDGMEKERTKKWA